MGKKVIILGAGGLVGNQLLHMLLDDPAIDQVMTIVRRPLEIQHPKLFQVLVDFSALEKLPIDFQQVDAFFCCIGTTIKKAGSQDAFTRVDLKIPLILATMAKEKGVDRFFLVSSLGASAESRNFYLSVKGKLEVELGKLGFKQLCIARPSMLLGKRSEFRMGELIGKGVMTTLGFLFLGKLKRYKAIDASAVAKALYRSWMDGGSGTRILESEMLAELGN